VIKISDNNDFVSLWKKKKEIQKEGKPSVIGETIDRLTDSELKVFDLEKQNADLKQQLAMNLQIIEKSEDAIRASIAEKEKMKEDTNLETINLEGELKHIKTQNDDLINKIASLETTIKDKEDTLTSIQMELQDLKAEKESEIEFSKSMPQGDTPQELIENLKTELSKKNSQINSFESKFKDIEGKMTAYSEKIEDLTMENKRLKNAPGDAVSTAESSGGASTASSKTLDALCQDLQSDINKYKRVVKKLKDQNSELKKAAAAGGTTDLTKEVKTLQKENANLKKEISKLEKATKKKEKAPPKEEPDAKVKELQAQLDEKDKLIRELKAAKQSSGTAPAGLVDDLQKNLTKYKNLVKKLKDENKKLKSG